MDTSCSGCADLGRVWVTQCTVQSSLDHTCPHHVHTLHRGLVPMRETGKIATTDSIQVGRLRRAGAIVVGKTNTPADGHIAITKNLLGPPSCNPWALDRSPGGSSGGAAAAVAARMVPWATASDGGGSIRIPATLTGTFGHKVRNTLCFPLLLHHFLLRHLPEGYPRILNLNHYVSAHLHICTLCAMDGAGGGGWWTDSRRGG